MPARLLVACAALALALGLAPASLAAGAACDESQVLLPRTSGVTTIGVPDGPQMSTWPSGGDEPTGVAWSPDGTRAYVGAGSALTEIDPATGAMVRTVTMPSPANAIAISVDGRVAYVAASVGSDGIQVVDLATFTITATIQLDDGTHIESPNILAISPDGTTLYAAANWGGTTWGLFAISTASRAVTRRASTGTHPTGLVVTSDGRHVLATRTNFASRLDVFDPGTLAATGQVTIDAPGAVIGGIAVGDDPTIAYVADGTAQDVAVVDVSTATVLRRLTGFQSVAQLALNRAGTRLVVAGTDGSFSQTAWDVVDPASGEHLGSGLTTGAGGMSAPQTALALCPRYVPPAPAPRGSAALRVAAGCVPAGPVIAVVTVRNARAVSFYRNGRLAKRVAVASGAQRAVRLVTRIRADDYRRYRLVVRVRYRSGAAVGPRVLARSFHRCRVPAVTG